MKKIDSGKYYMGASVGLLLMAIALAGDEEKLWPMSFLLTASLMWRVACMKWDD